MWSCLLRQPFWRLLWMPQVLARLSHLTGLGLWQCLHCSPSSFLLHSQSPTCPSTTHWSGTPQRLLGPSPCLVLTSLESHPIDFSCFGHPEPWFLLSQLGITIVLSLGPTLCIMGRKLPPGRQPGHEVRLKSFLVKDHDLVLAVVCCRKTYAHTFCQILQLFVCWRAIQCQSVYYMHIYTYLSSKYLLSVYIVLDIRITALNK